MRGAQRVVAIDFDGVLHEYHGWNGGRLLGPIPGALELVNRLLAGGAAVVVFTTRDAITVRGWLKRNGFPEFDVTDIKRAEFDVFLDDRAIGFHPESVSDRHLVAYSQYILNAEPHWKIRSPLDPSEA